ncbi:probable arabinosyltransferase ARAD1 [Telopea speciosissima]|uniref:probable arabinosyltransferase ARAD1 n=1 Tax=Telopea speciosissima TaxID=54955 RepID=UPI001CC4FEE0|nr:probable arabinosyltransferase ARAD1 [Telopea speciosissima]XP_043707216.1 probable arabinosyltransferase ARAD1 [Telopea speciosissima]
MAPKCNTLPCTIPSLLLSFSILCVLPISLFFLFYITHQQSSTTLSSLISSHKISQNPNRSIRVYVADLPRSLNYGLLDKYWSLKGDSRLGSDVDNELRSELSSKEKLAFPPYPENPLVKQYSAEYWILGDLMTPEELRGGSYAKRVFYVEEADVIFVPFFATLSAEIQLGMAKGVFRKKIGNEDYERQRQVVELIRSTDAWKRSGGRDHVFVLTDPVAMWHVRAEIAPAVLLVVDFGGWYRLDSKASNGNSTDMIQHTQVSLLKDVIVPYTYLLPRLHLSENQDRHTLLYFKGAKHRHRGGLVREKLWDLLVNEPGVVMEEGFPNATGREQSIKGMRTSEFCLHPAGDTPTSCRLFDAIQSLCIPVIVSDDIELPFEGMLDYMDFSVFVSVNDALQPNWLVSHLKSFSKEQRDAFRRNMAHVQPIFEYDNGHLGGIGPIPLDGAVNHIWKMVHQKVPMIKEAIIREKRKPKGVSVPLRCHCT